MFYFLLTLLILDALILSAVVLLQAGQGGGLASLGGSGTTDTVLGGRQAVTILTKATWWCGGIFLVLSLVLSFVRPSLGGSELQERLRTAAPTMPTSRSPLETSPASPAVPSQTAPGAQAPATQQAAPAAPAPKPAAPAPSPSKP